MGVQAYLQSPVIHFIPYSELAKISFIKEFSFCVGILKSICEVQCNGHVEGKRVAGRNNCNAL